MKKLILIIILLGIWAATAHAANEDWSAFGDAKVSVILDVYLDTDDKNEADRQMETFIEGWMDGLLSAYAYELFVIDGDLFDEIETCAHYKTPAEYREFVLSAGRMPELEMETASLLMYWFMRTGCVDVLGELETSDGDEPEERT